ncbi:hypothetical protein ON058_03665 [Demequina sp. B12]|uniref:hypothetical protein n=1 Tax=Demequina sp. B12 TaxID=2992757 RepID=UPI00237B562B|nr:hypothetical protein [Demequina sp. B12]MDE0572507.1 hypothetical protein [Demequina sp. B12]
MASAPTQRDVSQERLRALAFWVGHHQMAEPQPHIGPRPDDWHAREEAIQRRVGELELMVPELKRLAGDARPQVRTTVAKGFAMLAQAGRGPADRDVWGLLLDLSKYDTDPVVRAAAEEALDALERHGAVARTVT